MGWLTDPIVALEALADAPQLHARPTVLSSPVLRVCIGSIPEGTGPQHDTAECKSFHEELQVACLDACTPHVTALIPVGGQSAVGTKGCAIDLQFSDGFDARLQRHALCDTGSMTLQTSHGQVHVPVRSQPGRIPSSCAQLRVHGLPAEFRRQGLIMALLACAGYGDSALVQAEFGGELPAAIAACHPQVVRGDVAVGVVKPPAGDAGLKNLPRCFYDRGNGLRIGISVETQGDHRSARAPAVAHGERAGSDDMHVDRPDDASSTHSSSRQQRRRHRARQRRTDARREVPFVRATVQAAAGVPPPVHGSTRGLSQPLDAVLDLGGQMGREGIGHSPQHRRVQLPDEQIPAPHAMDCAAPPLPVDEPLVEACMLWLEDRVSDLSRDDMHAAVAAFREQHPASWQPHVHSRSLPSRAFRNALRAEVRCQHYGAGIDSDSDDADLADEACVPDVPASSVQDDAQAAPSNRYCIPHRRRAQGAESLRAAPTRTLPPRSNRGVPANSPYWAGTASQSAAPRGSRQ